MRVKNRRYLTWADRLHVEAWLRVGKSKREIAALLEVSLQTVYNELKRGEYLRLDKNWNYVTAYSPDIADEKVRTGYARKGAQLKIGKSREYAERLEQLVVDEHFSPAAALAQAKKEGHKVSICKGTFYSYIDKGIFLRLTNKNLPVKGTRKRAYKTVKRQARASAGTSIERRPKEVDNRKTFGHWEMDTVVSGRGSKMALLVLTERKTRAEIIRLLDGKTAQHVLDAINALESEVGKGLFEKMFKTITVDNGGEFAACADIEVRADGSRRTQMFYCHAYTACERGSNENQNRLIRRFFPKGWQFSEADRERVAEAEAWINDYPRRLHGWKTARQKFDRELAKLTAG